MQGVIALQHQHLFLQNFTIWKNRNIKYPQKFYQYSKHFAVWDH